MLFIEALHFCDYNKCISKVHLLHLIALNPIPFHANTSQGNFSHPPGANTSFLYLLVSTTYLPAMLPSCIMS